MALTENRHRKAVHLSQSQVSESTTFSYDLTFLEQESTLNENRMSKEYTRVVL